MKAFLSNPHFSDCATRCAWRPNNPETAVTAMREARRILAETEPETPVCYLPPAGVRAIFFGPSSDALAALAESLARFVAEAR